MFEQFRRISNFYFLTVVVIQLIPQITPLTPITSILPLAFVLLVTAAKEALEDYVSTHLKYCLNRLFQVSSQSR